MKRSEMLLKLERLYYIRHVMVESGHLPVKDFMDEILATTEQGGTALPIPEPKFKQGPHSGLKMRRSKIVAGLQKIWAALRMGV